jgi:hypothetical protein
VRARFGWSALLVVAALLAVLSALGGGFTAVRALVDGDVGLALSTAAGAGLGVVFWRWIALGALLRLRPPEGVDPAEADPVGPWGIVGRVLLGLMVVGFVGTTVWIGLVSGPTRERAEKARDEAVRLAEDRDLTAADVRAAITAAGMDVADYADLLPLTEGTIVGLAADGDRASILIRVDGSPPCAAVDITHDDIIRGRLTDRC